MNLVIDDTIFNANEMFAEFGTITQLAGRDIAPKHLKGIDILIVRSRTKVNQNLLKNTHIKFVGSAVSGLDHIDIGYLNQRNIKFAHAGGCNANAVAEFVISNILNLANKYNFDYQNKVLGIIGYGNVGSKLKQKAQTLEISVLLNDIKQGDFVSLEYLLKNSDIISLHTPLDQTTYKLLNAENFCYVKADAIIINTARGGVIDEKKWLQHQGIKIVDCWKNEPNISQLLLQQAELATQHIAGHSIDAKFMGSYMIYQQLCTFLNVTPKQYSINFDDKGVKMKGHNLTIINKIYDFKNDDKVLRIGNFEDYRRHYPPRFEWHNYGFNL